MEFGLEEAALASNVDVSVPADAESTQQVRFTSGHGVKKFLEFGMEGEQAVCSKGRGFGKGRESGTSIILTKSLLLVV